MKNIGFILLAFFAVTGFCSSSTAQTRTTTTAAVLQGNTIDAGGTDPGGVVNPKDSLQVTDSLAYIIPVNHTSTVIPYLNWYWSKVGSGTATLTFNMLQSNDGVNFFPVLKGAGQISYTKSYTLSASTWSQISFINDTAFFEGRYLKYQLITSSTASVEGRVFIRTKITTSK